MGLGKSESIKVKVEELKTKFEAAENERKRIREEI
jgi:hypothetical protein